MTQERKMNLPPLSSAEKRWIFIYSLHKRGLSYADISIHPKLKHYRIRPHSIAVMVGQGRKLANQRKQALLNIKNIKLDGIFGKPVSDLPMLPQRWRSAIGWETTICELLQTDPELILRNREVGPHTLNGIINSLKSVGIDGDYPIFKSTISQQTPPKDPASMVTVQKAIALLERYGYTVIPPKEP